jgi:hypothetical protein
LTFVPPLEGDNFDIVSRGLMQSDRIDPNGSYVKLYGHPSAALRDMRNFAADIGYTMAGQTVPIPWAEE